MDSSRRDFLKTVGRQPWFVPEHHPRVFLLESILQPGRGARMWPWPASWRKNSVGGSLRQISDALSPHANSRKTICPPLSTKRETSYATCLLPAACGFRG